MTEGGHSSSLHDYVRVLRRRKWAVLQALVIVPVAAVLFSLQQEPLYQASSEVLLSRQNLAASLTGTQDPNASLAAERLAQTQAELARVPLIAQRVLGATGLADDRTPQAFLSSSSVSAKANSDLLVFTVTDRVPEIAALLTTEYARQFTRYRRELDTAALVRARQEVQSRIAELETEGDRRSALYASLVDKEQQLNTMEALQTSNALLVRRASEAEQIQPKPVRNGILAGILGLLLGIGLAFLWEALDTRVRSAEEVRERLGLPLLGRIPEPAKRLRSKDKLVMLEEPRGHEAEAFRVLRTNLEFVNLDRGAQTIMITSAVASEGKSTTAANLAVACARAGRRVVLVDLDLRRPYLDHFFELPGPGFTEVALGEATLDEALEPIPLEQSDRNGRPARANSQPETAELVRLFQQAVREGRPELAQEAAGRVTIQERSEERRDTISKLEILPSGPIPPDVGEFVASNVLADILVQLRQRADLILIDSPPILQIGDALALTALVDAVVLVTRLDIVRRPMLSELRRTLDATPVVKLGFVLTGADQEDSYGGAYAYAKGYPYRAREEEKEREPVS